MAQKKVPKRVRFERTLVTPSIAKELLKTNERNRALRQDIIDQYAAEMKKGYWNSNSGETIKIDWNGKMHDGQHRLMAIVLSKQSVEIDFALDCDPDSFKVIDSGKKRTPADVLHVLGVKNAFNIASMIRFKTIIINRDYAMKKRHETVSSSMIVEMYKRRPAYWQDMFAKADFHYRLFNKTITPAFVSGWYAFLADQYPAYTEVFFNKLCGGIGIQKTDDPIGRLRNVFIDYKTKHLRMTQTLRCAYFVTAWNLAIKGEKIKRLYIKINSAESVSMVPEIILPKDESEIVFKIE